MGIPGVGPHPKPEQHRKRQRERRVGPLAPGKYTLIATTLDGKDAKKSVLVEAGQEERKVKLRLR